MPPVKVKALILKKTDFGETSVILEILTEHYGKIDGILKGARSPKKKIFPLTYSPGSYIDAIVYIKPSSGLELITDPFLIKHYDFENEKRFFWKKILSDINNLIPQGRIDTGKIFSLLIQTGDILPQVRDISLFEVAFQAKLLSFLGFGPFISKCVLCGSHEELCFFSGKKGGVVCKKCGRGEPSVFSIPRSNIEIMRFINKLTHQDLLMIKYCPENICANIKKCFDSIVEYHISGKK